MRWQDLPIIAGRLTIEPFQNPIEDGFGLLRTDTSPSVEVAIIHDSADRRIGEAEEYARLLNLSPVMLALLRERSVPAPYNSAVPAQTMGIFMFQALTFSRGLPNGACASAKNFVGRLRPERTKRPYLTDKRTSACAAGIQRRITAR